ncbi:carbon-nitrogen hydrolase family protein [Mucilaginibacter ginsenosidivorax]|uniref:Carbon-nitrogen hydrolase family protein n=1 Tax=Mucilaginibacter ginsenosidivorax TaxID=862126 RepID=A0A5B8VTQ0_9SPHI|nr:carbon-nitrogen hydrolase family protein [Mucilaginibacter ginsenosidivorax]QEC74987.1 carbon-nitrogen hydrolase family protein [Mucilaginibacter ginsenosidivorax]
MKIAIASPPMPASVKEGLQQVEFLIQEAANQQAEIICFPESYIPGYPAEEFGVEASSPEKMRLALDEVCAMAAANSIAIIMPMDWYTVGGVLNVAHVISKTGEVLGYQTKNQLDPSEDSIWIPGTERHIFEVNGVKFGITICHEGFRYPESVRWAARNDAKIVFHPHCTGSNIQGVELTEWGSKDNPYYEKAIMLRAMENTIYFASSNYAFRYPDSASCVIAPDGTCIAHETYGKTGVIIADIDPDSATGLLARRFKSQLYI